MPRLILLLAVVATLYLLVRRVQAMPPHKRRAGYLQLVFGGVAVAAVVLTLMGKMHWVGAALTGLLVLLRQTAPLLIRAFPLLQQWLGSRARAGAGQQSQVTSAVLSMTLDHNSGELDGVVLEGEFKDWRLGELSRDQLTSLLDYCRSRDEDSVQLLLSYLEQRFPNGQPNDQPNGQPNDQTDAGNDAGAGMNRTEALKILGLDEGASDEDIVSAHRRLMQKLHPDRGGNDYLAAKINEAKAFLLGA